MSASPFVPAHSHARGGTELACLFGSLDELSVVFKLTELVE